MVGQNIPGLQNIDVVVQHGECLAERCRSRRAGVPHVLLPAKFLLRCDWYHCHAVTVGRAEFTSAEGGRCAAMAARAAAARRTPQRRCCTRQAGSRQANRSLHDDTTTAWKRSRTVRRSLAKCSTEAIATRLHTPHAHRRAMALSALQKRLHTLGKNSSTQRQSRVFCSDRCCEEGSSFACVRV